MPEVLLFLLEIAQVVLLAVILSKLNELSRHFGRIPRDPRASTPVAPLAWDEDRAQGATPTATLVAARAASGRG